MHVMNNKGTLSASSSKSSRHRLTEEERNMRRLISNRESASRAVERRRAMHEALKKNASELAMENESLKREKEQALEYFNSLKRENECLKEMMAEVEKGELNIQPFYCFLPLQTQDIGQNSEPLQQSLIPINNPRNEECLNLFYIPSSSSTPNVIFHQSELSIRRHEGSIRFALEESSNVRNRSDVQELNPTAGHCYGQSSSCSAASVGKKSDATEARRRRKELNRFKYIYCSDTYRTG